MKTFIEFSIRMDNIPFEIENKIYQTNEFYLLDGKFINIYKGFKGNEIVSIGKFVWDKYLYLHFFLKPEDLDYFESFILHGIMVPMNIKITTNNVEDKTIKGV